MPLIGDWRGAERALSRMAKAIEDGLEKGIQQAARDMQTGWVTGITEGKLGLKPNAPLTRMVQGSSRPLVASGAMVRSINRRRIAKFVYGVGIMRSAKGEDGQDLVNVAAVQEYGAVIRPKKAKALAVPVSKEARRAGSPRKFPRPLTYIPSKRKTGNVHGKFVETKETKSGRGSKSIIHYMLLRYVVIPARPHRANAYQAWIRTAPKTIASYVANEARAKAA